MGEYFALKKSNFILKTGNKEAGNPPYMYVDMSVGILLWDDKEYVISIRAEKGATEWSNFIFEIIQIILSKLLVIKKNHKEPFHLESYVRTLLK